MGMRPRDSKAMPGLALTYRALKSTVQSTHQSAFGVWLIVIAITANDLKLRGVSILEEQLKQADEVIVSVRGRDRFVVMKMEKYSELRELELDRAIREARADYDAGRVFTESVAQHMKRVSPKAPGR
jgi:hypothetical protein